MGASLKTCFVFVCAIVVLSGCEQKFDLSTLPQPGSATKDTAYLQISPSFGGFTAPQDVMVGNDQLLYVADTRGNRIVMMNLAGAQLSARSMLRPISLAQDSRLDLLVGGEIVAANGDTVGAIFRIHLVSSSPDSAHRLEVARIDTVWREIAHPQRKFPGIAVLPDNTWLAVRNGTDNSSPIDPDARVLEFDKHDVFITPVPAFITGGQSPVSINKPTAIATIPGKRDFILSQSAEEVSYAALWMQYLQSPDFEGWLTTYDASKPSDFFKVGRYSRPEAVAIDRVRGDIFIADAALDSVFKFNSKGAFRVESFGRGKSGGAIRHPSGLTFFGRILYVLDDSTSRLNRFILSSDTRR